jgi:hypothetical protein
VKTARLELLCMTPFMGRVGESGGGSQEKLVNIGWKQVPQQKFVYSHVFLPFLHVCASNQILAVSF